MVNPRQSNRFYNPHSPLRLPPNMNIYQQHATAVQQHAQQQQRQQPVISPAGAQPVPGASTMYNHSGMVHSSGGLLPKSNNAAERVLYAEVFIQGTSIIQAPFPDLQQLTGKIIIGIEAYNVSQVPVGPVTGYPVFSSSAFNYSFLQLNDDTNTAIVDRWALTSLNPQLNAGLIRKMFIKNVVWTNSKLLFAQGVTLVANTVAYFVIHYLEPDVAFGQ